MKSIKSFFSGLIDSPKTTAAGIAAIAIGVRSLALDPIGFLSNETAILAFLVGIGLLLAPDHKQKES
jgi:hypothetical protein